MLTGKDAVGTPRQLAMTIYDGWDDLGIIYSTGTNPDSKDSIVVYAQAEKKKQYGGCEPYVMISQVITKEDEEPFTKEEIFPVRSIAYTDKAGCGTYADNPAGNREICQEKPLNPVCFGIQPIIKILPAV